MMHQPISQVSLSSTSSVISADKSSLQSQQEKAERDEKYAALAARKEALERQIKEKNAELKRFCVQEAELTGSLPLETPLEPGEMPPSFRRRMGTGYTIPESLIGIDNSKSNEEQTLAALELEYKILSQITSAAMRMASDVSLKRAVRRQRRIEYQQNSKRLTDLEHRLNEARKNQAQKHRKKPRPASEIVGSENSADKEPSEGGFGMTNLTKSVALSSGRSFTSERPPTSSSSSSSLSHNLVYPNHTHESTSHKQQEKLHSTLSAPHQYLKSGSPDFRTHRQLQRHGSGGNFTHHHTTFYHHQSHNSSPINNYPTLTGASLELERLSRHDTAFIMSPGYSPFAPHDVSYLHHYSHTARPAASQNFLEMDDNDPLDGSPSRHPSMEGRSSRWKNRFGSLDRKKKMAQSSPCLDSRSVEGLDILQTDNLDVPDRGNFIIPTSRPSHKTTPTKRAETKQLHQHHSQLPPPVHHRHKSGTPPIHREPSWQMTPPPQPRSKDFREPPPPPATTTEALLPGQTYPEPSYGQPLLEKVRLSSGGLIRTQSLGSVGTSSSSKSACAAETRSIKDMYPSTCVESRSIKDMYPSTSYTQQQQLPPKRQPPLPPVPQDKPPSRRPSGHSGFEVKDAAMVSNFSALHVTAVSGLVSEPSLNSPQGSIHSAGSEQLRKGVEIQGGDNFEMVVPFESPKNHMVIQAGKWQPYWEESKPFEMSDFYKYSTKFRNKTKTMDSPTSKHKPLHLRVDEETAVTVPKAMPSPTPSMSPQQKGVYQPLQPMTCQAVDPQAAMSPELPAKQGKVMSPNMSLNMSNGGESLADAFSSEMLAWYQDKSTVPRSATLV